MSQPHPDPDRLDRDIIPPPGHSPHDQRLHAALLDAQRRLIESQRKLESEKGTGDGNFKAALKAWTLAVDYARKKQRYVAWDCLHQVDDCLIADMTGDGELRALWCSLAAEADEKLKGWRRKAGDDLQKLKWDVSPPIAVARQLHGHLATSAQNMQFKLEIFERRTLPVLMTFLAAIVGGAVFLALLVILRKPSDAFDAFDASLVAWANALILAVAAGLLGGVLSMAFSLGRLNLKTKIPESRLSGLTTSIRPLLGAAVAIPVMVFVKTGYVAIKGLEDWVGIFAICFLGGFSERWFLGLMERFEGSATDQAKQAKTAP
jgi:hypothetical protein